MLLADHPIKINDEKIIWPESWEESSEVIENVNLTAAGTDQTEITRLDKLSIACEFLCSPEWAMKFKAWSKMDELVLCRYDILSKSDEERIVRMRNFSARLLPESWKITPDGIWEVRFDLLEF